MFSSDDEEYIAFEDPVEARNADTLLDESASKFNKESSADNIEARRSFKSKASKAQSIGSQRSARVERKL